MSYELEMPPKTGRNGDVMLQGTEVTLEEMLQCREQRAQIQRRSGSVGVQSGHGQ